MSWDDFEDDAEVLSVKKGPTCSVGRFLDTLDYNAREAIESALDREELTTPGILKAIKKRTDTDLSATTMRRHRRGECAC